MLNFKMFHTSDDVNLRKHVYTFWELAYRLGHVHRSVGTGGTIALTSCFFFISAALVRYGVTP